MAWRYRYRLHGKLEKLTLGKYPALSLKNARRLWDEAASAAAMGTSPAQQKKLAKVAEAGEHDTRSVFRTVLPRASGEGPEDRKIPRRYLDKESFRS